MTVVENVAVIGIVLNAVVIVGTGFAGYIKLRAKVDSIVVQTTQTNGTIAAIQGGGCDFRREHIAREIAEAAAAVGLQAHSDADRAHADEKLRHETAHSDADRAHSDEKLRHETAHSDADRAHADAQGAASELQKGQ